MSNPNLPTTTQIAAAVPVDLQNRLGALFTRMAARGLTETFSVLRRAPVYQPGSQRAVARALQVTGTFPGWAPQGGGSMEPAQEAHRVAGTVRVYAQFTAAFTALLDDNSYQDAILLRGNGDQRQWRVESYVVAGPYVTLMIAVGSTADKAGNVR